MVFRAHFGSNEKIQPGSQVVLLAETFCCQEIGLRAVCDRYLHIGFSSRTSSVNFVHFVSALKKWKINAKSRAKF